MKSNKIFSIALSVFVSFVFVFAVTFAASTISTNISTGGTLTVSDNSVLASSDIGGGYTAGSGSGATISATGAISANGDLAINGFATTTATTGAFATRGAIAASSTLQVTGNQTNYGTITVSGTGATTLGGALSVTGVSTFTGLGTFLGGATTTLLTLLNGETITNTTDGTITLTAATTSLSGLGLFTNGFLSQASSTVVGNLTVTGTFSPAQTVATSFLVGGGYGDTGVTISTAGVIQANGALEINGFATTTAANGNFATLGTLVGSSTLQVTGAATLYSTLSVTGVTTLVNASSTNESISGNLWVGGNATTTAAGAISTNGSLTLANTSTAINGIVFGFCNIANSGNITASSTGYFNCTGATGVTTSHRVFVQATSSLPTNLIVVAASSTAQDTINLLIYNTGTTGLVAPGGISLNFFGIR